MYIVCYSLSSELSLRPLLLLQRVFCRESDFLPVFSEPAALVLGLAVAPAPGVFVFVFAFALEAKPSVADALPVEVM